MSKPAKLIKQQEFKTTATQAPLVRPTSPQNQVAVIRTWVEQHRAALTHRNPRAAFEALFSQPHTR